MTLLAAHDTRQEVRPAVAADAMDIAHELAHRLGRRVRILHIGNIANNAYLNAKILNAAGFDCDVICYDYYHVMGCPEWEDADVDASSIDQFRPNWSAIDLGGFERPHWFAQGPASTCLEYLSAHRRSRRVFASMMWWRLTFERAVMCDPRLRPLQSIVFTPHVLRTKLRTLLQQVKSQGLAATIRHLRRPVRAMGAWRVFRLLSRALQIAAVIVIGLLLWGVLVARLCWRTVYRAALGTARRILSPLNGDWIHRKRASRPGRLSRADLIQALERFGFQRTLRLVLVHRRLQRVRARRSKTRPRISSLRMLLLGVASFPPVLLLWMRLRLRRTAAAVRRRLGRSRAFRTHSLDVRAHELASLFVRSFPDRVDKLSADDLWPYRSIIERWAALFKAYDVVIGYATDGLYPLLAGKRPYFAYEHGTIRNIPFEATLQGRLCALTYRAADTSLITNCDNIVAAQRLGLTNHRFVPHPVNEDRLDDHGGEALRHSLRRQLESDFLLFHPARQHWEPRRHPDWEKGNDILIEGFARFVHEVNPRAAAVFVEWGQTVAQSKALLTERRVADRVLWIRPQANRSMVRYIQACDVVADQFHLGAFGSLTPKALLHGCPVMLRLDEERHRWCFPEMPPVVNVRTPEQVYAGLTKLYREAPYRNGLIQRGREWYMRYHSNRAIARTLAEAIAASMRSIAVAPSGRTP